jgi:ferredoxin
MMITMKKIKKCKICKKDISKLDRRCIYCKKCVKNKAKEALKLWKKNNPDKVKLQNKRSYQKEKTINEFLKRVHPDILLKRIGYKIRKR